MALIRCTECGQMISDKASRCPMCGCPNIIGGETRYNANVNQQPVFQQPMYNDASNMGKWQ